MAMQVIEGSALGSAAPQRYLCPLVCVLPPGVSIARPYFWHRGSVTLLSLHFSCCVTLLPSSVSHLTGKPCHLGAWRTAACVGGLGLALCSSTWPCCCTTRPAAARPLCACGAMPSALPACHLQVCRLHPPSSMMVAVPVLPFQHSPMLGHCASSQTVASLRSRSPLWRYS